MSTLGMLLDGFSRAMAPGNLLAATLGCFLGTVVGILPGIGPSTTVALLIPVAFAMNPDTALIMMMGVYCGAMYGGALTSILVKVPGEASSVMTAVDGYELAKKGKGGVALVVAQVGSFIGGTLSVVGLMTLAPPLASFALRFGPAEYFAVMLFALAMASTLMGESLIRGGIAVACGLLLACIGTDLQTGVARFTMGVPALLDGIDDVLVIMGVFGVGEVLWYLVSSYGKQQQGGERMSAGRWLPNRSEWRTSLWPILRGALTGFMFGVIPAGGTVGSFMAYSVETRVSRHPEKFGKGALEAVAAVETANNASTGGAMVPLLSLGIPGSGTTAVLLTVLMMYGLRPGPLLMVEQAPLMWAVIASMYVANVILLILNLPLVGLFVKILEVPLRLLMPMILSIASVGAYAINYSLTDVALVLVFGLVGFAMRWAGFPPAALVLGVVLGERLEQSLRQALMVSEQGWKIFFTHPISVILLLLTAGIVLLDIRRRRQKKGKAEAGVA